MGKCVSTPKSTTQPQLRKALTQAIRNGKLSLTKHYYNLLSNRYSFQIDDPIVTQDGMSLNPLALAFEHGRAEVSEWLVNEGADVNRMRELYRDSGTSVMDRICERGYLDLLQFFLPIHLASPPVCVADFSLDSIDDLSIFLDQQPTRQKLVAEMRKQHYFYTPPIQRACKQGHVKVVQWLWKYFEDRFIPKDFDVESVDEYLDENSALVAVRNGRLDVMKFLYEQCAANFHRLNRRSEGAIQIAVIGSRRYKARKYLPCLKYLIESIGIDPTYRYDETLLLCESNELLGYLEEQLRTRGVRKTKAVMERENDTMARWRDSSGEEGKEDMRFEDEEGISVIPVRGQGDASAISMF